MTSSPCRGSTNEQIGCSNTLILTAASAVAIALSYIFYRRCDIHI